MLTAALYQAPASARKPSASPFDLAQPASYIAWRERKLADLPHSVTALQVPVADPRQLTALERQALLARLARFNMAIYISPALGEDSSLPRDLGLQLGLKRLDANWLAEEDGISRVECDARRSDGEGRGGFIPYTDRAIGWHTDGYYHPAGRCIRSMMLHCVRDAAAGGENQLLDPELVYIALRDEDPRHIHALMDPEAMTIPARQDESGVARAAQSGPVFSVDERDGALHMRYTARTRSIVWKDDGAVRKAVAALQAILASPGAGMLRVRMSPGMGLVCHNVLHDRSAFQDDALRPRLVLRARFLDRAAVDLPGEQ